MSSLTRLEARSALAEVLFLSGLFDLARIGVPNRQLDDAPSGEEPWCRVAYSDGTNERRTIGKRARYMRSARFVVQVFVAQGSGYATALNLAESVAALYEGTDGGCLSLGAPNVEDIGVSDGWYQFNVSCTYDFSVMAGQWV